MRTMRLMLFLVLGAFALTACQNSPDWALTIVPGFIADPAHLPDGPGAYLILFDLTTPAALPPRFGNRHLDPGIYVYAGNAHGPGGIQARAGRHLRADGARRWHIDWLTGVAARRLALPLETIGECEAIHTLARGGAFTAPISGFGSSDCSTCAAHLLHWQGKGVRRALGQAIEQVLFGP